MAKSGPFRIEIKSRNHDVVQLVTCTKSSLTVGSGAANDLVLSGPLVQPQHLRIDFYGSQVQIVNVNLASDQRRRQYTDQDKNNVQRSWRPGEAVAVGDYILTLLSPAMIARANQPRWLQIGQSAFGTTFSRWFRLSNLPSIGLSRVRWLLILILGGLLLGSCSTFGRSYMQRILPKPITFVFRPGLMEPTPSVAPPPGRGGVTSLTATAQITLTPTPKPPHGIPTRVPIRQDVDVADAGSQAIVGLVDGPQLPTSEALTVLVTVTPTAAPTLVPTATISPVETIQLSQVLEQLGVWVEPAIVPVGQPYWRLTEARWLNEEEALARNYIFIEVVDKANHRLLGQAVTIAWKDDRVTVTTNKSAENPYALDFLLNASGNAYTVSLPGMPSDTIHGLGMGTIEEPLAYTKTAFWLKFQQTTRQ